METGAATSQLPPVANQETLWVGRDHLTITDSIVIIDAACEIPDWQVRDFQRMPIFLGDFKFFLRNKLAAAPPFTIRYVLERWPADAHFSAAPISFVYDEQFVQERDAEYARTQRYEKLGRILTALYPFLGFLWSGAKKNLISAGFIPRSITGASVFTGVCLLLLQGVFLRMKLGLFSFLFGSIAKTDFGLLVADYMLLGLILLDTVLRFDQHVRNTTENPWGFCEWVTAPFRRKPIEDEENA